MVEGREKNRLKLIRDWILTEKFKKIVDVGTDHGYLPLDLIKKNQHLKVWATDIIPEIITNLEKKTKKINQIIPLCYDGIPPLKEEIDLVVITGLGAKTIIQILTKSPIKTSNYLLQTNHNPFLIRKWIWQEKLYLKKEKISKEKNIFYHTLLVSSKGGKKITNWKENYFGPCLLANPDDHFYQWWKKEREKKLAISKKVGKGEKFFLLQEEIKLITAILKNQEEKAK